MAANPASKPLIIRFYDPTLGARDARDRTLEDILTKSDQWFERCHDYVQMLFPLPEGSMFNYLAPVIDRQVYDEFRARADLRNELRRAFTRMMGFYGFEIVNGVSEDTASGESEATSRDATSSGSEAEAQAELQDEDAIKSPQTVRLERAPSHERLFRNWVMKFNHNHLRITRILRSLRVLGLEAEAHAFLDALEEVQEEYESFSPTSLMYWHRALERPLWIAPDDEQVDWLQDVGESDTKSGAELA